MNTKEKQPNTLLDREVIGQGSDHTVFASKVPGKVLKLITEPHLDGDDLDLELEDSMTFEDLEKLNLGLDWDNPNINGGIILNAIIQKKNDDILEDRFEMTKKLISFFEESYSDLIPKTKIKRVQGNYVICQDRLEGFEPLNSKNISATLQNKLKRLSDAKNEFYKMAGFEIDLLGFGGMDSQNSGIITLDNIMVKGDQLYLIDLSAPNRIDGTYDSQAQEKIKQRNDQNINALLKLKTSN